MYKLVSMTNVLYFDTIHEAVDYIDQHGCENFKLELVKDGGKKVIRLEETKGQGG